jgi:Tol biopolymer transport system component
MKAAILAVLLVSLAGPVDAGWENPVNLGPTINSTANDWYPVLARDGSFMIFVSTRAGGFGDSDLWIARRIGGVWQAPQNLGSAVNTATTESAPYLAQGDSTLYFFSRSTGGGDVYMCPLVGGVPGLRANVGSTINSPWLDCCPVVSRDGSRFYICSERPGGCGSGDVWVSHRSGSSWSTPANLGPTVNTAEIDCPRWLSDDGSTMLICSTRAGGIGNADMWITENDGVQWSAPVNLGTPLNSAADELGGWFAGDAGTPGGTIFFGSGRSGGSGGWDLWTAAEDATDAPAAGPDRGENRLRLEASPNPASSGTTFSYSLPEEARVVIDIYDVQGRVIRRLLDRRQMPGDHTVRWDASGDGGSGVPSGVCYCKMQAGERRGWGRVVLRR